MINVNAQINSVQRVVGSAVLDAGEAHVVTISQSYDATIDDVWDACTNPDRIPRWFLPITGELRVGGHYQLEGNAGGVVERCEPPGGPGVPGFDATWEFGDQVTGIEVRLTPAPDGGTVLTLDHVGHVDDAFWTE